jgi:hypothetical protein
MRRPRVRPHFPQPPRHRRDAPRHQSRFLQFWPLHFKPRRYSNHRLHPGFTIHLLVVNALEPRGGREMHLDQHFIETLPTSVPGSAAFRPTRRRRALDSGSGSGHDRSPRPGRSDANANFAPSRRLPREPCSLLWMSGRVRNSWRHHRYQIHRRKHLGSRAQTAQSAFWRARMA